MAYNRDNRDNGYVVNEENVVSFLTDALSRIESAGDSDVQTLETLKKLFKKNVPFSRRNYVAAMLLKQAVQGYRPRYSRDKRNDRTERNERTERRNERNNRDFRNERATEERTERPERAPRVQIDSSLATTIFIGIGRNRRVYPRDLVGLLVSVAGLDRERIGEIRVLANYSFIQLYTEDCEKTIAALNDYEYRGRKLSVSYSRQKGEGDEVVAAASAESSVPAAETAPVATAASAVEEGINNDPIPANVTNESSGVSVENTEESKIAAEQSAFAAKVEQEPYSETTDDGQVKSHFGNGAAY